MKYIISIDFATKLGFAIWKQEEKENKLVSFSNFIFQGAEFNKKFKNTTFQQQIYEKTIYLQNKAKELVNKIFNSNNFNINDELIFIVEFSDFGFKYTIENLSRIFALFCVELNSYCKKNEFNNIKLNKLLAVQWRSVFKKNNLTNYKWSEYEVDGKKTKKIQWKTFAVDWMKQFISKDSTEEDKKLQFNNDVAEALLIGYTWTNYMQEDK